MSTTPLTPVQLACLTVTRESGDSYRGRVVPGRKLGVGPATLAALVRRGYLEKRSFPHEGYKLTARAEKLFSSSDAEKPVAQIATDQRIGGPNEIVHTTPQYLAGERAANTVLDLGVGSQAGVMIERAEKAAAEAYTADESARYLYLRGFLATLREFVADQGREDG